MPPDWLLLANPHNQPATTGFNPYLLIVPVISAILAIIVALVRFATRKRNPK